MLLCLEMPFCPRGLVGMGPTRQVGWPPPPAPSRESGSQTQLGWSEFSSTPWERPRDSCCWELDNKELSTHGIKHDTSWANLLPVPKRFSAIRVLSLVQLLWHPSLSAADKPSLFSPAHWQGLFTLPFPPFSIMC